MERGSHCVGFRGLMVNSLSLSLSLSRLVVALQSLTLPLFPRYISPRLVVRPYPPPYTIKANKCYMPCLPNYIFMFLNFYPLSYLISSFDAPRYVFLLLLIFRRIKFIFFSLGSSLIKVIQGFIPTVNLKAQSMIQVRGGAKGNLWRQP